MLRILFCLALCTLAGLSQAKGNNKDHRDLPPGLEKKLERTGELPPGWHREFRRGDHLPDDIFAQAKIVVPVGRDGRITVDIDGVIMKLLDRSHKILTIAEPQAPRPGKH